MCGGCYPVRRWRPHYSFVKLVNFMLLRDRPAQWVVLLLIMGLLLACATFRSPGDPVPTIRPSEALTVTITPTATPTLEPFRFGG